jgi:hypothetical protein
MLVSSPNGFAPTGAFSLTPATLRGLFLIWRSGLRGAEFAEVRDLDRSKNTTNSFPSTALNVTPGFGRLEADRDLRSRRDDLSELK